MKKIKTHRILILLLLLLIFLTKSGFSQYTWSCAGPVAIGNANVTNSTCNRTSSSWLNKYSKVATYLPFSNSPSKVIGINFIIYQDDFGNNGFTTADLGQLTYIFNSMRNIFVNNNTPSDPISGVTELTSKFIDFDLKGIYFYRNSILNHSINGSALMQYLYDNDPARLNCINIFINEASHGLAYATRGANYNFTSDLYVILPGVWSWSPGSNYASATEMAHEIGHNLDLCHTYLGGNCATSLSGMGTDPDDGDWFNDVFGSPYPGNAPHYYPNQPPQLSAMGI